MTELAEQAAAALSDEGPFAQALPGYQSRAPQVALSHAIGEAIEQQKVLVAEAGTGIGKTFAYLVPLLLSGQKSIVTTGTRHLQDQLFFKDLPKVCQALGIRPKSALLKGRANYLCLERLSLAQQNPDLSYGPAVKQLKSIAEWAKRTRTGDIAELSDVPENAPIWSAVTSNQAHCSQHEPEALEGCFCQLARRRAMGADLIVINHHLLCADLSLKDEGFGELLPEIEAIVVDEAHQLPEVAGLFFGSRISNRQLQELARDVVAAQLSEAPDMAEMRAAAEALEGLGKKLRLAMGLGRQRADWSSIEQQADVQDAMAEMREGYQELKDYLEVAAPRGNALRACFRRCEEQFNAFLSFLDAGDKEDILWFEAFQTGFSLNITPLSVAEPFSRAQSLLTPSWVFVSATLTVKGEFTYFTEQLGLEQAEQQVYDSPFNYQHNAILFHPRPLPQPNQPGYLDAALSAVTPIIQAAGGRTFFLFTSHRALEYAANVLDKALPYPLLVQGQASKLELIEQFKSYGDAVLLGTASFWEGVDVRGDALSCVIIDKLPFAAPNDPVLKARLKAIEQRGGAPFEEYQLPKAVMSLKQGVGRLIRDVNDRGVMVICDPRLVHPRYGRVFLDSLPPMHRSIDLSHIHQFFGHSIEHSTGH